MECAGKAKRDGAFPHDDQRREGGLAPAGGKAVSRFALPPHSIESRLHQRRDRVCFAAMPIRSFLNPCRRAAWLLAAVLTVTAAAEEKEPARILVLGDSLAAGNGIEPGEAFPALLQEEITRRGWKFSVINAGVSGDTSAGGLRRVDWLLRQRVDVLLLELGGNDGLRGIQPEATRTNLQSIIDRTREKYPGVRVVIAGMKMPPNMGADYTGRFEKIFPELAARNQAALVPFLLEGVGGRPELNLPDRIHPTPEGHRIVATNVWKVLGPVLERMQADNAVGTKEH
jgi:acyl-CoA thioesterase-1